MALLIDEQAWALRLATPDDNARLCELVRQIHMKGKLDVTQERDPDFFALSRMHLGDAETWVFLDEARNVEGCASLCMRDAWLDGARIRTAYWCDLRLSPKLRGGAILGAASRALLRRARETHGIELFHDVVFDTNEAARSALEKRGEKRRDVAVHSPMTPFDMTSVQLTTEKPAPSRDVRRARDADLEGIVALLREDQRTRTLGFVVDEALMRARIATWPGLSIESFLVSRDSAGRIDGCVAPWDTSSFKRTRVLGYHGEMRVARAAFDVTARLRGFRRLPKPGECFDFSFLTHLTARDDDPAIVRDLVLAVYRQLLPTRQHFVSAMVPRGSPVAKAFNGFTLQRTPMTLYAVYEPGSAWEKADLRTLRPGFEMALS